jgi:hypothetical protein
MVIIYHIQVVSLIVGSGLIFELVLPESGVGVK